MLKASLLGGAAIALAFQAADTAPGVGPFENMGQVWLALITLGGTVVNALITLGRDKLALQREERQRQWLVEDRRHAEEQAERVREELIREQDQTRRHLDENTDIARGAAAAAKDAYVAANNVNEKIAQVGALRRADSTKKRRVEDGAEDGSR